MWRIFASYKIINGLRRSNIRFFCCGREKERVIISGRGKRRRGRLRRRRKGRTGRKVRRGREGREGGRGGGGWNWMGFGAVCKVGFEVPKRSRPFAMHRTVKFQVVISPEQRPIDVIDRSSLVWFSVIRATG